MEPTPLTAKRAFDTGLLLGHLVRMGVTAEPVMDGQGNYTDRLRIEIPRNDGFMASTTEIIIAVAEEN